MQTTLTRIFIALESESHGLSKNSRKARKFKRFFRPKTGGLQKKKKRSSPKLRLIFRPNSEIQTFFQTKNRWSPKKKRSDFLANIRNSNAFSGRIMTCSSQFRLPISFGGGCFQFFTKNRPQKHKKRAILHTLQANGGGSMGPLPPLATLLGAKKDTSKGCINCVDLGGKKTKLMLFSSQDFIT